MSSITFYTDDDNDGMPDSVEIDNQFDPLLTSDAADDEDMDGLTNLKEYQIGTNLKKADTDGDGRSDGDEFNTGTNPTVNEAATLLPIFNILFDD